MFDCVNIWRYRHLILHKSYADFRADSERTYLGVVWWVLEPLFNMMVFYVLFGVIMQRGGPDFIPFLIVGMTMWGWFGNTVLAGARSILKNVGLIRQISFHKVVFPVCISITNSMKLVFSLGIMFVVLFLYGFYPNPSYLALPVLFAVQFLLILGVTLPLCAVLPFVPDLSNLLDYVFRVAFYMSGVFFSIDKLSSERLVHVLRLNPMAIFLMEYRGILMYNEWPNWRFLGGTALVSLAFIYFGAWLIWRFNAVYAKRIV